MILLLLEQIKKWNMVTPLKRRSPYHYYFMHSCYFKQINLVAYILFSIISGTIFVGSIML